MFLLGTQVRLSNGALKKVEQLVPGVDQVYTRNGPITVASVTTEQREEPVCRLESGKKKNTVRICGDANVVVRCKKTPKEESCIQASVLDKCFREYYIPCAKCLVKNCNFVVSCKPGCLVTVVMVELDTDCDKCVEFLAENTFFIKP